MLREGHRHWTFQQSSEAVTKSLQTLAHGRPFEFLQSRGFQEFLLKERLIYKIQKFQEDQNHRTKHWLAYQSTQAEEVFVRLQSKTVLILGCGGTGGLIAEHLVRAGVRSLILLDGDFVDAPDLNRQLHFSRKDIGKMKVTALRERLLDIQPDLNLQVHHRLLTSTAQLVDLLEGCPVHLVVCAVDQPIYDIQVIVGEACLLLKTPVLFGAVGIFDAVIGPLFTESSELEKQNQVFRHLAQTSSPEEQVVRGSLCFTNSMAAAQMSLEAYKFLTGYGGKIAVENKALITTFSI